MGQIAKTDAKSTNLATISKLPAIEEQIRRDIAVSSSSSSKNGVSPSSNNPTDSSTKSPWGSLWLCFLIQFLCYVQFSIYFSSMWPYLSAYVCPISFQLDSSVSLHFFGMVTALFSFGQAIASPFWGVWCQKSRSTRHPVSLGVLTMALGNLLYASLPAFHAAHVKWAMLGARLLTGIGAGILGCLRAYVATASVAKDRSRAVSLSVASGAIGIAVGPALQTVFLPFGTDTSRRSLLVFNMYTTPAWAMIALSLLTVFLLQACFRENYAGIINTNERDGNGPPITLPKFDRLAAAICIYLWVVTMSLITGVEVMLTPLTIAIYDWKASKAVLYNGLLQAGQALATFSQYITIAYSPIGKFDGRKMMLFGLSLFLFHHIASIPWPFYDGPLNYIQLDGNSTIESTDFSGGCYRRYSWCSHTSRIPLPLFVFSFTVICGFGFSYLASPVATIFSKILGPRRQGTMQGIFALFGGLARCATPLFSTSLFEFAGYLWIMVIEILLLVVAVALVLVFYHRLVPLNVLPRTGTPIRYKSGIFYRF